MGSRRIISDDATSNNNSGTVHRVILQLLLLLMFVLKGWSYVDNAFSVYDCVIDELLFEKESSVKKCFGVFDLFDILKKRMMTMCHEFLNWNG